MECLVYDEMSEPMLTEYESFDFYETTVMFPEYVEIPDRCGAIYQKWGQWAVFDFVRKHIAPALIGWAECEACDIRSPFLLSDVLTNKFGVQQGQCLVCSNNIDVEVEV